jgi:hypothetical protein
MARDWLFLNTNSKFGICKLGLVLMAALIITSCASKKICKELELSQEKLFFEFYEPQPIKKTFLPSGRYRCYYKDEKGCFFEAPSILNEESMFSRGGTGGIYIIQSDPIQAFIFS